MDLLNNPHKILQQNSELSLSRQMAINSLWVCKGLVHRGTKIQTKIVIGSNVQLIYHELCTSLAILTDFAAYSFGSVYVSDMVPYISKANVLRFMLCVLVLWHWHLPYISLIY